MKLQLKKFDMSRIKDTSVVVMIGSRNSGKSFLVRDLLYHHQNIPVGMVISGTEGSNEFYSSIVPGVFIHEEYTPELLDKYVQRQKTITRRKKKEERMYGNSKIDPRAFIIMDDCLYDKSWTNDKNIRACFLNGRHFHAFFIFTSQYALAAPPMLRNNIDYVFVLREPRILSRKKLHENYAGFVPTFDLWNQIIGQCTENYECLVIDNTTKSNKLTDQLYWYKAESRPDFCLCDKSFWQLNKEYDSDEEDDEELLDLSSLQTKRNSPEINMSSWGPFLWTYIHKLTLIDNQNDLKTKEVLMNLPLMIPVESYRRKVVWYIETYPVPENNKEMFLWTVDFHNWINMELGKKEVSYQEACKLWK